MGLFFDKKQNLSIFSFLSSSMQMYTKKKKKKYWNDMLSSIQTHQPNNQELDVDVPLPLLK